jgi:hypothetical protein
MKKPTIFFIAVMMPFCVHAQNTSTQSLYWTRYQNLFTFNPTWQLVTELDNRRFFTPDTQTQFILHNRIHYRYQRWEIGLGYAYSFAYANRPELGKVKPKKEIRPVIEANYKTPIGKFFLGHRLRIDHRFLQIDRDINILEESDYVLRTRYRLQLRAPIKRKSDQSVFAQVRLSNEFMFNHYANWYDQNRIYCSIEWNLSKSLGLETGYIYIHQQAQNNNLFSRHVARFTLIHRISL